MMKEAIFEVEQRRRCLHCGKYNKYVTKTLKLTKEAQQQLIKETEKTMKAFVAITIFEQLFKDKLTEQSDMEKKAKKCIK